MPPWRSRSMSLMLSAPATIPATRAATFTSAFAPALPATVTCSSTRSESPGDWASSITGTNPPVAIRLSSSNSAEKLWETRTPGAPVAQRFGTLDKSHPRWPQEHPALTTRRRRPPARRIQAERDAIRGHIVLPNGRREATSSPNSSSTSHLRQRSSQVRSPLVAQHGLTRAEFYARAARLDEAALRKALWTLYWRGSAQLRERIEAQLDPQQEARRRARAQQPPDPELVLRQVRDFVDLARRGSYLAGDRRVSPTERSRWRMAFRSLAKDAQAALRHEDVDTAATAVEMLVDLACETRERDLFRSGDPMDAAGFVVSDAGSMLWSRL